MKLVDQFLYLGSNIPSTVSDVNICIGKAWITIVRLSIIWKSNLFDKIRWGFFKDIAVSAQLYGCTTLAQMNRLEKKLDWKYTRMLHTILNKT